MERTFSKAKFLAQPIERQHKKCAELLRKCYEAMAADGTIDDAFAGQYRQMQEWMNDPYAIESGTIKEVADRYHHHLQLAGRSQKEHNLLPTVRKGDRETALEKLPVHVYLERLRSAHNVGSILRTVEALGFGVVYFAEGTPFADHLQVQNCSMEAYRWVDCQRVEGLEGLPRPLIVLETGDEALSLYSYAFPEAFTLAVGNEETGCSDALLREADVILQIPMRGRKNSLNVANAFALAAGEILRQKEIR